MKEEIKVLIVRLWGNLNKFQYSLEYRICQEKKETQGMFNIDETFLNVEFRSLSQFRDWLQTVCLEKFSVCILFGTCTAISRFGEKIGEILQENGIEKVFRFQDREEDESSEAYLERMEGIIDFLWEVCEPANE